MDGGNFLTDFFTNLWGRLGFGKKVESLIASGNFNPNDIVAAKGVLSEKIM